MENLIKGWISTVIGLVIIALVIVHYFGIYEFPHPSSISTNQSSGIALFVGLIFFFVPASKIEALIEKIINKKSDQV